MKCWKVKISWTDEWGQARSVEFEFEGYSDQAQAHGARFYNIPRDRPQSVAVEFA